MKMNFKYAMMAFAALSMGMASCSDNPVEGGGDTELETGAPTLATIRMVDVTEKDQTRAYGDFPALPGERKIERAKVYVFNSTKILVNEVDLQYGTIAETGEPGWVATFEASAGKHYFVATANAPTVNIERGRSMDHLYDVLEDIQRDRFYTHYANLEGDSLFFMTTPVVVSNIVNGDHLKRMKYAEATLVGATEEEIKTNTAPVGNHISVPVGRAMAKINLTIEPSVEGTKKVEYKWVINGSDTIGKVLMKNAGLDEVKIGNDPAGTYPVYKVANNPHKMYHFPYFGGVQLFQTPLHFTYPAHTSFAVNYWPALHDETGFFTFETALTPKTDLKQVNPKAPSVKRPGELLGSTSNPATPEAFYAMENSNDEPTWSNATILQVKAQFVPYEPLYVTGIDTSDPQDASKYTTGTYTAGGVFFRAWDPNSKTYWKYFFADKSHADAVAASFENTDPAKGPLTEAGSVQEYKTGLCYYMIPVRDLTQQPSGDVKSVPQRHDVIRNHFYDIEITNFTDCGYYTPGGGNEGPGKDTEPKDPLYPDPYFCQVSINIVPWTHVLINEDNVGIGYK
ncbi:Mfa1 family fimbria major subunit [Bacteroides sp. 519]|uniref:Mfa1 family fimbria major subunit n=1 Tax=Bacteroides sp. 519 TaxID=2302937 RepID=UPI0013D43F59|nr:Mfa1 family fimbria major subunit [Bacteroides sp. 519]